jgi:hypothetical protein
MMSMQRFAKASEFTSICDDIRVGGAARLAEIISKEPQKLRVADEFNFTVAHCIAGTGSKELQRVLLDHMCILKLGLENGVRSVAHELAANCSDSFLLRMLDRSDILRISLENGWSVAHEIASRHASVEAKMRLIGDDKLLKLQAKDRRSVAHILAVNGLNEVGMGLVGKGDVLRLVGRVMGVEASVAHELAAMGSQEVLMALLKGNDIQMLGMLNGSGRTVIGIIAERGFEEVRREICGHGMLLNIRDRNGLSTWSIMEAHNGGGHSHQELQLRY